MTEQCDQEYCMYTRRMGAYLNRWFANYEDARASLELEGGFLFPYERHFFVTTHDAVLELGLDPNDPDWSNIGYDWVQPNDSAAFERLKIKRAIAS